MTAKVGDRITVDGRKGAARTGEILEVIPSSLGEHYRVRWNDGHETDIRPAEDYRATTTDDQLVDWPSAEETITGGDDVGRKR